MFSVVDFLNTPLNELIVWYGHVIIWPYLDIVSAPTVGRHLLSLVRRCLTLCQMIYEILQSALQPSDSRWRHVFSLPISMFSALGVSHVMRSINALYCFTYLLTYGMVWFSRFSVLFNIIGLLLIFSFVRGRQQLSHPVLRPPNGPNARPQENKHLTWRE